MSKFKKKLRSDFESNFMIENKIDVQSLKANRKSYKTPASPLKIAMRTMAISFVVIILIPVIFVLSIFIEVDESPRIYDKSYSLSEKEKLDKETFKSLNSIKYPTKLIRQEISEEYKNALINFTYNIDEKGNDKDNYSYSPMNLYSNLHLLSLGYKNEEMVKLFDEVLGIEASKRSAEYKKMYENNFKVNDDGTTQMYHGAFLSNGLDINEDYINSLTDNYVEAFSLDFTNDIDINLMLEWINNKMQDKNFFTKDDLYLENTIFYLFSALYFSQGWYRSFLNSDTYEDTFYMKDNQNKRVSYMHHTYSDEVYEYDKYFSFYDKYENGYRIQYVVSKDDDVSIDEAIKGQNIFIENPDNKKYIELGNTEYDSISIDLTVPKMDIKATIKFNDILKEMGLGLIFNRDNRNLDNVFNDDQEKGIEVIGQKNHVVFNEDGTIIKSLSFAGAGNSSPGFYDDALKVKLDHPFIYVIYDYSGLPLFVGHVDTL